MRGEASGHKALQTSMRVEQVLATQDLPVTEDTTLHDLSQREKATQGDCSTYRSREEQEWLELPLHQKIEKERRTLEEAEGRERARLPMRSRQDSEATVDKRSPHQRLMQAAIMAIRWQNLGNKLRARLQDSEDDVVDMNEEEAETEWERCSPCPLCGMACSVDHDNGVDERKCSHSITQPMGIHEWTRERPACSKTKTEGAEDTSLSAKSRECQFLFSSCSCTKWPRSTDETCECHRNNCMRLAGSAQMLTLAGSLKASAMDEVASITCLCMRVLAGSAPGRSRHLEVPRHARSCLWLPKLSWTK